MSFQDELNQVTQTQKILKAKKTNSPTHMELTKHTEHIKR